MLGTHPMLLQGEDVFILWVLTQGPGSWEPGPRLGTQGSEGLRGSDRARLAGPSPRLPGAA